jgi:hypothetical protein
MVSATPTVDAPKAAHPALPSFSLRKRRPKNAIIGGPQPTMRAATVALVSESPQNCTRNVAGTLSKPTQQEQSQVALSRPHPFEEGVRQQRRRGDRKAQECEVGRAHLF